MPKLYPCPIPFIVTITDEDKVIMLTCVYLELERVLLGLQTSTEERL